MALLTIVRKPIFADVFRAYKVIVDGQVVGEIKNGETKQFSLPSGQHQLHVKIDWCGSKRVPFTLSEGGEAAFEVKSNIAGTMGINGLAALYYLIFARDQYLVIKPLADAVAAGHS